MYFFDALKRRKIYKNRFKTHKIEINSEDYLSIPIEKRIGLFESWLSTINLDNTSNLFEIDIKDTSEFFIEDEEVFNIMSSLTVAYAKTFEKQIEHVLTPKQALLNELAISPISLILLTTDYIVDKPYQIIVNRNFNNGESVERIKLI